MVLITIVTGAYKPTYNWGASPCGFLSHFWDPQSSPERNGPTCLIQGQQLSCLFPRRIPEDSPGESLCIADGEYIPYTMCD